MSNGDSVGAIISVTGGAVVGLITGILVIWVVSLLFNTLPFTTSGTYSMSGIIDLIKFLFDFPGDILTEIIFIIAGALGGIGVVGIDSGNSR
jgi:hypothetical protein